MISPDDEEILVYFLSAIYEARKTLCDLVSACLLAVSGLRPWLDCAESVSFLSMSFWECRRHIQVHSSRPCHSLTTLESLDYYGQVVLPLMDFTARRKVDHRPFVDISGLPGWNSLHVLRAGLPSAAGLCIRSDH